MPVLNYIRGARRPIPMGKKVFNTMAVLILGIAWGVFSKFLDTVPSNELPFILARLDSCAIQYDISIWMDLCGSSIHPGIAGFYLRSGVVKAKHMEGNDPDGDARHWDCRDPGGDPSVSFRMKVFPAQKIECQPPLDSCDWFLSCVIKCCRALSSRILRHLIFFSGSVLLHQFMRKWCKNWCGTSLFINKADHG